MDANNDCPLDLPSPRDVAARLMNRAWDDDVSDDDRELFELASLTVTQILDRCVERAAIRERDEAHDAGNQS
jgi:hypothetical protein